MTNTSNLENPKISIVMACYNAENTISWSIKSILNQTFKDFEIICIDDCSTDSTFEIIERMAQVEPRIRAIQQAKNSGVGTARTTGINYAKSEIIGFLDDDDFFEVDFLERLHETMLQEDADVVQCGIRYIYNDSNHINRSPEGIVSGEHCSYRIDTIDGRPYLQPQLWNKLYRKHLFKNVSMLNCLYEDAEFIARIAKNINKFVVLHEAYVNYNKRYSRKTGTEALDVNKVASYFNGSQTSILPFFTNEMQELRARWNAPLSACTYANISNYLRGINPTLKEEAYEVQKEFLILLEKFSQEIKEIIPQVDQDVFFSKIHKINGLRDTLMASDCPLIEKTPIPNSITDTSGGLEKYIPLIDRFIPKKRNLWLFSTWGHYSKHTMDNPRAIYEQVKNNKKIKKIILMNNGIKKTTVSADGTNTHFVNLKSKMGIYYLIRSGYIFTGYSLHNIFGYRRLKNIKNRKIIQLWHGIPIKKVGLSVDKKIEPHWQIEHQRYEALPSSSVSDQLVMRQSFSPSQPERVKLTGLPRHDIISMPENDLPEDYKNILATVRKRTLNRRLFIYAPTWRSNHDKPNDLNLDELRTLDKLFSDYNCVLGVRLHRNMLNGGKGFPFVSDNIIQLDDIPDVNVLLRESSAVITDYSSLYLDFMLLNRPVLLYTPDLATYRGSRGLNYKVEDFLPHHFEITNFISLTDKIELILKNKFDFDDQYSMVKQKFHHFLPDGKAAQRLLNACDIGH